MADLNEQQDLNIRQMAPDEDGLRTLQEQEPLSTDEVLPVQANAPDSEYAFGADRSTEIQSDSSTHEEAETNEPSPYPDQNQEFHTMM